MDEISKTALTMSPCEICAMLGTSRSACTENSYKCCGTYTEIICAQWDATCKLIRERTGKKK